MMGKTWLDLDGFERTANQWGFNSFTTAEGAAKSAARIVPVAGGRCRWYIWRLSDGTFDYTAIPDPEGPQYPAELVDVVR
jgi:hypothetical protein